MNEEIKTVAITGAGGLIGRALCEYLSQSGHNVLRFVRNQSESLPDVIRWDPPHSLEDDNKLESADAIIHLAGESLVGRWNERKKLAMYESRIGSTQLLVETIRGMNTKPKVFIGASAIGYYGSREDSILTESSPAGDGYLADMCLDWEAASKSLTDTEVRLALLRTAFVLAPQALAVKQMITPFKLGLGATLGRGEQYMSWITLVDVVRAIEFVLHHDSLSGALNLSAPEPVTNKRFTKSLAESLNRPTFLSMPKFAVRLMFGAEQANEMFLSSVRVVPERLLKAGFDFEHASIKDGLAFAVKGN